MVYIPKVIELIRVGQTEFTNSATNGLGAPAIRQLLTTRENLETKLAWAQHLANDAHPLSPRSLAAKFYKAALVFQHGLCSSKLRRKLSFLDSLLQESGLDLLEKTSRFDTDRTDKIRSIRSATNPFWRHLQPYSDLLGTVKAAISAVDSAVGHINAIEISKGLQYVMAKKEGNTAHWIKNAAIATEAYNSAMIGETLSDVKKHLRTVYQKASQLKTAVLPNNTDHLSSSEVAVTYAATVIIKDGTWGRISQMANIFALEDLRGKLGNVREGLSLLHAEAAYPVVSYYHFEEDRENKIADINKHALVEMLNHKIDGNSLVDIHTSIKEQCIGGEYAWTVNDFRKTVVGFGIGLAVAFSAASGFYAYTKESLYQQNKTRLSLKKATTIEKSFTPLSAAT